MTPSVLPWTRWLSTFRTHAGVRTPTVLQMEAVECGAASLAMILAYFGRHVPLDELRIACGVSRDGSNAASIVKVAKQYGLVAKAFRHNADEALQGPVPAILFWGYNHFLVLEGVRGGRIFLNDPALGRRSVSRDEFDIQYSGVVLTFEKGADFKVGGQPPRLFARLVGFAADYRKQLAFVLAVGALVALPGFVVPGLTVVYVDKFLVNGLESWFVPLILAILVAVIMQACLTWTKAAVLLRLETQLALQRSADFLWYVLRLPASFFGMRFLGDIAQRVMSVETVAHVATTQLGGAVIGVFTAAVIFLLMIMLAPVLAAITLAGILLNVLILRLLHQARIDISVRLQADNAMVFATAVRGIRLIETVKATGSEDDFFAKWAGFHARVLSSSQKLGRLDQASAVAPAFIAVLTMAAALFVGGMHVMDGALTLGVLLGYQALYAAVAVPVQQVVNTASVGQKVAADLARLDDVYNNALDWRHTPPPPANAKPDNSFMGLRLDSVSFGYNPLKPPLIENFSVDVGPGDWIALVGPSGSGKSTLGKLISGLYTPWSGEIRIDGRSLAAYPRRELANLLAAVDQEIALFAGTVRDNICLWDDAIPVDDVHAAVCDAGLREVISARAGNLDAEVDEGGRNFSGGERQRMEIARALVRSPVLLVLDEATSALDPETELEVMTSLKRRGIACVVVAHRLSTIRDCDEIIMLDGGRVVERGDHAQLVARNGAYAKLVAEGETP